MSVTILSLGGRAQTLPDEDAIKWLRETTKNLPLATRDYAIRSRILFAEDVESIVSEVMA